MDFEDRLHGLWAWIVFIVALITIFGFIGDAFANGCHARCENNYAEAISICQEDYRDPEQTNYCVQTAGALYGLCLDYCGRVNNLQGDLYQ